MIPTEQLRILNDTPASDPADEAHIEQKTQFRELGKAQIADQIKRALKPMPDHILIGSLRDGRLRVTSPIKITFMAEAQHVIAEAEEFNEFGYGSNKSESIIDIQHTISELFLTLEAEKEALGPELRLTWLSLQQKIQKYDY